MPRSLRCALALLLLAAPALAENPYRTVVVFGDTQRLVVQQAEDPSPGFLRFLDMARWVADNREAENIDFVLHVGDITQNGQQCTFGCDEPTARMVNAEWDRFMEGWSLIEQAGIPYAIVPGNHDNVVPMSGEAPDTAAVDAFGSFFGRDRFTGDATHVATCDAATPDDRCHGPLTLGHVWRFRLGEQDVLVAGLPDRPGGEVQAWFEEVLRSHPELPVVLLSHQWLRPFDLLWFRYLTTGRGGSLGPLTAQAFMAAMGHVTQDLERVLPLGDYRVLAVEFDRQGIGGSGDAAIALIRFYFDPAGLDGVDALRLEPGPELVRDTFPGRTPFSIDNDLDNDGVPDPSDLCPEAADPGQEDLDGDFLGDACDGDLDGDGHPNETDVCIAWPDPDQRDTDGDGLGDVCDADLDEDGDVDRRDLRILTRCASAPGGRPRGRAARHDPSCRESDLDGSGRVDPEDLTRLLEICGEACSDRPAFRRWGAR